MRSCLGLRRDYGKIGRASPDDLGRLWSGPRKGDEVRTAAGIVLFHARLTATPIASPPVTWSKVLEPEGVARFRRRVPLSCSPATTNPGFAAHSGVPFAQARL